MFGRMILLILLAYLPIATADDLRYPNGSLYYIVLDNFQDEKRDELDALAVSKFKDEVENRGYRLTFINGGDIASIKKAAFDPSTAIIVISGHGDEKGSVTGSFFEGPRLRSIFQSGKVSNRLTKVVLGTCYSSCVAENWNLRNGKIVPLTFGHFPIGIEWFQNYLTSPPFLSQLGTPRPLAISNTQLKTAFESFRENLESAKTVDELRDAIASYKNHSQYDANFDAARIRDSVYQVLLRKPDIPVNFRDFQTASNLDFSNATMSDLFLRFSRSGPTIQEANAGLRIMNKLAKHMPIESSNSALAGAENLAKVISEQNGGDAALSMLKQIEDDDLRGAFGFQLLREAKTPREFLNVLNRLPASYAEGTLGILLNLEPTPEELLEGLRRSPSRAMARNNLYLALQKIKDPDAALTLFRGFRAYSDSKADREFFDNNLTSFFQTSPSSKHYKSAISLCHTKLCREFVARSFVSQSTTAAELQAVASEIRSGKLILDPRLEMVIQSRAAALKTSIPASLGKVQATKVVTVCHDLYAKLFSAR